MLQGRVGGSCAYESIYEIEGGYSVVRCEVPAVGFYARATIPKRGERPWCTPVRSGNVFADMRDVIPDSDLSIEGTHYSAYVLGRSTPTTPVASDDDSPVVAIGSMLRVSYRLFDDDAYTRPTDAPDASGEIVFRYGAGEVGSAIERVFSGARRGAAHRVRFREEVGHGVREKLPRFERGATICAELALLDVGVPAPWPAAERCPDGHVWYCQLGPNSVEKRSDSKICGCRARPCHGFLWSSPGDGAWPDGTRKGSFECIDDEERVRRTRALP